jgi:hypothetical protein
MTEQAASVAGRSAGMPQALVVLLTIPAADASGLARNLVAPAGRPA